MDHAARPGGRLGKVEHRKGVPFRIRVVGEDISRGDRKALRGLCRISHRLRRAIGHADGTIGLHGKFRQHPIPMTHPARTIIGQGGMFQQFEPESGDASGDAFRADRVAGGGRHVATNEDGFVWQQGDRFPSRAGGFDHVQDTPVRGDIPSIDQAIRKVAPVICRGRQPEAADEMLPAKGLGHAEGELGIGRGTNVGRGFKDSRHGGSASDIARPASTG